MTDINKIIDKIGSFFESAQTTLNQKIYDKEKNSELAACFVVVWTLLSRIPLPKSWWPKNMPSGNDVLSMAPAAGGILGLINGLLITGLSLTDLNGYVCGLVGVAFYFAIGWALHLDGWSDLWDGIGSCKKGEELRLVMKDSRLGAYGGASLVIALALWAALISSIEPHLRISACVTAAAAARFSECTAAYYGKYPWEKGMASGWVDCFSYNNLIKSALCLIIFIPFSILHLFICTLLAAVIGYFAAQKMNDILGGVNGDVMGACAVASELLSLLVWAVF